MTTNHIYDVLSNETKPFDGRDCLDSAEPIWTEHGLEPIGNVQVGDLVVDRFAKLEPVLTKRVQKQRVLELSTGSFHYPLRLTSDHTCLVVRKEDAKGKLPFLKYPADRPKGRFSTNLKSRKRCYKSHPNNPVTVVEVAAQDVKKGDFFLFPVIPDWVRSTKTLGAEQVVQDHDRGCPNENRIYELPVNKALAYAYGVWLAEGNANVRNAVFSFHAKEAKTLGLRVSMILGNHLGLSSRIYVYDKRNSSRVVCSKRDLADLLAYWFGDGAENKKIPTQSLYWPKEVQETLLLGYMHGDGNKHDGAVTVSSSLAAGLYALAIQCGKPMTVAHYDGYVDKEGVKHLPSWRLYLCKREAVGWFFEPIGDQMYFWSPVEHISPESEELIDVVDITVAHSNSFVTRLGMVHNAEFPEPSLKQLTSWNKSLCPAAAF